MTDPHILFDLAGPLATAGWVGLVLAPLAPIWIDRLAGIAIPALLSLGYTALMLAHWAGAPGGYDSLENVMALFTDPNIALAGWVHYLAFDLFVGGWIVRQARGAGIPHLMIVPLLVPTLFFGPAGLVAYLALRAIWSLRAPAAGQV